MDDRDTAFTLAAGFALPLPLPALAIFWFVVEGGHTGVVVAGEIA